MSEDFNKEKDTLLLRRFNDHEPSAFAEIYKKFFTELHAYAIYLSKYNDTEAEDIVQEAFIALWERKTMKFETCSQIKAFLYAIIKNQFGHYYEHLGVKDKYKENIITENKLSDEIEDSEMTASLIEYIEHLTEPGKEVMQLYLKGYEAEDIATKMQFNVQTIYNIKSKAIRQLRQLFKNKMQ